MLNKVRIVLASMVIPILASKSHSVDTESKYRLFADKADSTTEFHISILSQQSIANAQKDSSWQYILEHPNLNYIDTLSELLYKFPANDTNFQYYYTGLASFENQRTSRGFDILEHARTVKFIALGSYFFYYKAIHGWADNMMADSIYFERKFAIDSLLQSLEQPNLKFENGIKGEILWALRVMMFSNDTDQMRRVELFAQNELSTSLRKFCKDSVLDVVQKKNPYRLYKNTLPPSISHDTLTAAAQNRDSVYVRAIRVVAIENMALEGLWDSIEDEHSLRILEKINPTAASTISNCGTNDSVCTSSWIAYKTIKLRLQKSSSTKRIRHNKQQHQTIYTTLLGQPISTRRIVMKATKQ